jgi:hypothetical protein
MSVTGSSVYTYSGLYPPYYLYVEPTFHHMSVTGSSVYTYSGLYPTD